MEYEFRPGDLAVVSDKNGIAKEFRGLMCRIVSVKNYYGIWRPHSHDAGVCSGNGFRFYL